MSDAEQKLDDIHRLIRLIVNERISDLDLREDALQEAMLAAWERLRDGKSHGIAIHAAKQAAIDVGMGKRMTGSKAAGKPITRTTALTQEGDTGDEYVVEPADIAAQSAYDAIDEGASLEWLLATLTHEQRTMVLLRLDGLTQRQLASRFGVSHQAIGGRLAKAYVVIRNRLEGRA